MEDEKVDFEEIIKEDISKNQLLTMKASDSNLKCDKLAQSLMLGIFFYFFIEFFFLLLEN